MFSGVRLSVWSVVAVIGFGGSCGSYAKADPSAAPSAPAAAATTAASPTPLPDGCPHYASENLILDPGAELATTAKEAGDVVPVPDWTPSGKFTAVKYAATSGSFATLKDRIAKNPGLRFFAGGSSSALSTGTQVVALSDEQLGTTPYALCGWFGGYAGQNDNATLTATFLGASGARLASRTIGGVKAAGRTSKTSLIVKSAMGKIPAGTTQVKFVLTSTRTDGSYNDGYADNLHFSIGTPGAPLLR